MSSSPTPPPSQALPETIETSAPATVVATPPPPRADVIASPDGVLKPRNIEEAFRVATAFYKSKLLPQRYNSAEMVLTAMQFALELGLKPLTALRQIAVVNGTPSLFGDLPLSLCYASNRLEWIREYWIEKEGREISAANNNLGADAWGAIAVVKRRGDPTPLEAFFTMADAQKASLTSSPTWKAYPKRMLRYRARSQALKDKFPDALNGVAIAEYDFHVLPEDEPAAGGAIEVADPTDKAAELSAKLRSRGDT